MSARYESPNVGVLRAIHAAAPLFKKHYPSLYSSAADEIESLAAELEVVGRERDALADLCLWAADELTGAVDPSSLAYGRRAVHAVIDRLRREVLPHRVRNGEVEHDDGPSGCCPSTHEDRASLGDAGRGGPRRGVALDRTDSPADAGQPTTATGPSAGPLTALEIERGVCRVCGHECGHQRAAVTVGCSGVHGVDPPDNSHTVRCDCGRGWRPVFDPASYSAEARAAIAAGAHTQAIGPPPEMHIPSNDARQRASHDEGRCPRCLVPVGHPIIGTLARLRRRAVTHHEAQLFVTANCTCVCHAVSPKDGER